jgi:hypothetical protein
MDEFRVLAFRHFQFVGSTTHLQTMVFVLPPDSSEEGT